MTDLAILEGLAWAWYERCVRLEMQSITTATFEDSSEFDEAVDEAVRAAEQAQTRVETGDWEKAIGLADAVSRQAGLTAHGALVCIAVPTDAAGGGRCCLDQG
ncbi:MAG: hypothetical protein FD153_1062 [Rhodospirillaceae bacterium]|nr:MAG: hypothetical protein FD153_1062 [Rhodospirillaceae bacterium]